MKIPVICPECGNATHLSSPSVADPAGTLKQTYLKNRIPFSPVFGCIQCGITKNDVS